MTDTYSSKYLTFFLRIAMGWTFFYAGASQILQHFDTAGFLTHTKTFHDVFVLFAAPAMLPYTDFLVKWGHLLIGLSLLSGFMVRASAPFGILLMLVYYCAHMDFPFVESHVNFIMDYHLVYAATLFYLIKMRAGHVWGLDAIAEKLAFFNAHPSLRGLVQ